MLDLGGLLFFELYVKEGKRYLPGFKRNWHLFSFLQMVERNTLSRWARVSVKRENPGPSLSCGSLLCVRRAPARGGTVQVRVWRRRVSGLFKLSGWIRGVSCRKHVSCSVPSLLVARLASWICEWLARCPQDTGQSFLRFQSLEPKVFLC